MIEEHPRVYLVRAGAGYNKSVQQKARQSHYSVRLWENRDPVEAIYRSYDTLPAEIQAELQLKRVWMLVPKGEEE